ncbi:hypothetical protein [Kiloniella antarctica]|uniref:STAS/SEC14 domain-containing protein n=1 Tax=Kiloniella antarctica TaxID=1550907 RepID=A0ABW5BKW8_9PROT
MTSKKLAMKKDNIIPLKSAKAEKGKEAQENVFSTPLNYEIDTPPILNPPRIECHLDKENLILYKAYIGTLHHDELVVKVLDIWAQIPDLDAYDNIIDIRFHNGDVGWHTLKEIGTLWSQHFDGNAPAKRTAFVSNHTTFAILAKAIQAFAPEQTFKTFQTRSKAIAWLKDKS